MHTVNGFTFESSEKTLRKTDDVLAGTRYRFVFDNKEEELYSFMTATDLVRVNRDQEFRWEKYGCLKMDDHTFFVSFEVFGRLVRECVTLVFDTESRLVTRIVTQSGYLPERRRMSRTDVQFGAIHMNGLPLPEARHGFTDDLIGTCITWTYSTGFVNKHLYLDRCYRTYTVRNPDEAGILSSVPADKMEPLYEEPAQYIRIRDGLYLCSFIEENMNLRDAAKGGNNLILLIDTERMTDAGRIFNYTPDLQPRWGLFHAYGLRDKADFPGAADPGPFRT